MPIGLWKQLFSLGHDIGGRTYDETMLVGYAPCLSCTRSFNVVAKRFPSLFPCGLHRVTYLKYCYLIFKFPERQFYLSYSLPLAKRLLQPKISVILNIYAICTKWQVLIYLCFVAFCQHSLRFPFRFHKGNKCDKSVHAHPLIILTERI